jgi:hypothetical protein
MGSTAVRYSCHCINGVLHTHEVSPEVGQRRGYHGGPSASTPCPLISPSDAIKGSLLGLLIGDALGAPLHWCYTWSETEKLRAAHFPTGIHTYQASPPAGSHPDSHKYFHRCVPGNEPTPSIFGPTAPQWGERGVFYHGSLPPGDNTLTGRLVGELVQHLSLAGGLSMDAWWQEHYLPLLTRTGSPPRHQDTWVDETHRVLFRNLAKGAEAYEAGMEDLCLTGIALCVPLLLAYSGDRGTREKAVRALCQVTHKSEGMVQQVMWWGDLLDSVVGGGDVQGAIHALFASFAEGRMDLGEVLSRGLSDEQAYHGPTVVFSSR